jgi:hypothetical protein
MENIGQKKYRTKNDGFIFCPAAETTIGAIIDNVPGRRLSDVLSYLILGQARRSGRQHKAQRGAEGETLG